MSDTSTVKVDGLELSGYMDDEEGMVLVSAEVVNEAEWNAELDADVLPRETDPKAFMEARPHRWEDALASECKADEWYRGCDR